MFLFGVNGLLFLSTVITISQGVIVCPTFKDYFNSKTNKNCYNNPDGDAEEPSTIIKNHGYNSTTYKITTKDGYTISIERLYGDIKKETPIIIGPGIYMNSLAFINRGNKSIAFFLANNGYEVWIINWRGTRYSRKHSYLSPRDRAFWNIDFHNMAVFDLKSAMEKIFEESKKKGIYIGFSMGTTIGLIFNMKEQIAAENTLKGMIHMAPIAKMANSRSILRYLNPLWPLLRPFVSRFKHGEVFSYERRGVICGSHPFQVVLCELLTLPVFGNSFKFLDPLTYPITNLQNRESVAIDVIDHYHQIMRSKSFREFNFGSKENLEKYDSKEAPLYDLNKLSLPLSMLVGRRDILATVKDTWELYKQIPETSQCGFNIVEEFGHREFINSKNVGEILFEKLLRTIEKIDNGKCYVKDDYINQ